MDTARSENFVQLDIDLLVEAVNGASYSFGRPRGSIVSPVAAAGIKAAARFLRTPKSVLGLENSEQNREVVRLYIEEFKNRQNFGIFPRLFSHRFRHHFGHDGLKGDMKSWVMTGQDFLRGFPNVQVRIRHLLADGDYVLEHNLATGDHRDVFRGVKATNQQTTWPEMHLYRLKDKQIVENWPMVSFPHIVSQLTKT